jgi:signal transduction histidine kinase
MSVAAEQSALHRVADLVARHAPSDEVFALVTEELRRLLDVNLVRTVRFEPDGSATILASAGSPELPPGTTVAIPSGTISDEVLRTGRPARIEAYERVAGPIGAALRAEGSRSGVGGPILVDGRVWGAMIAAFATDEPPPAGVEERVAAFAELVSTAISNVAAQAKVERLAAEQSALRRVATLVAREHLPDDLFATLARELGELLAVDAASILRYGPDASATAVAGWSAGVLQIELGLRLSLEGDNLAGRVKRSGRAQRQEDYAEADGQIAATVRELGIRSAVASPITVEGETWGVIAVLSRQPEPLPSDTEARLAEFSRHAAMAVANANSRADLAQSRVRIVRAGDEARRRFERDLHDGAQQRLVSLGLELRAAESIAPAEADDLRSVLAHVSAGLGDVLEDLRELSRGLHPAALTEGGLGPALRSLARRSAVPVDLQLELDAERLAEPIEVAAYYAVSEALANTVKHAGATQVRVTVGRHGERLQLTVADDGRGGADPAAGSGLTGLADRLEALGGSVRIDSPPGVGTTVSARLPTTAPG